MAGKRSEEIGIIGESLNLEPSAVGIDPEELRPIRGKGDLLDAVGIDQLEKVRVADGTGSAAAALDDGKVVGGGGCGGDDGGLEGGGGGQVHVHGHEATAAAASAAIGTSVETGGGLEGDGIAEEVGGGQNEDGGGGELHCCAINYWYAVFDEWIGIMQLWFVSMRWVELLEN